MTDTVGFIGLGNMGGPMALNLVKAGFEPICMVETTDQAESVILGEKGVSNPPNRVTSSCA